MAETTETREEREARWWAAWFEADYSWEGLAKKDILGGGQFGEKTLQDYWRRDPETGKRRTDEALREAGELIECEGRWWHLVHLPLDGDKGKKTWNGDLGAQNWARFNALTAARLAVAIETLGAFDDSDGVLRWVCQAPDGQALLDGRALFDGAVLWGALRPEGRASLAFVSCRRAVFLGGDFDKVLFGPGTDFYGAAFLEEARFSNASFSSCASFQSATFSSEACFEGVHFLRDARFDGATFLRYTSFESAVFTAALSFRGATFASRVRFDTTTFSAITAFHRATLLGEASFTSAIFSQDTRFDGATFSADVIFDNATFSGFTAFSGAAFAHTANFENATFSSVATFQGAAFSGSVSFFNASFSSNVSEASFQAATFKVQASFASTTFSGSANFDSATFGGDASFADVRFSLDARFDRAIFSGNALFVSVTFSGEAFFNGAIFEKDVTVSGAFAEGSTVSFSRAVFKGLVRFAASVAEPAKSFHRAFYLTQFLAPVEFDGAVASGQAGRLACAFVETIFKDKVILDDGAERDARQYFRLHMLPEALGVDDAERNARLRALEAGCRTLKVVMDVGKDELRQQRYYRFQLMARQRRSDTEGWERAFGRLYGWTSDYGSSFSLPLASLAVMTVMFGLLYWGLGIFGSAIAFWLPAVLAVGPASGWTSQSLVRSSADEATRSGYMLGLTVIVLLIAALVGGDPVWQGQKMALSAVFRPFATLAEQASKDTPAWPEAAKLGLHVITTTQSLLSGVLIFLFGLAVKRRFQIS